jgi:SAM-dependent methyltransferase
MELREAKTENILSQLQQRMRGGSQPRREETAALEDSLLQLGMVADLAERCRANATSIGVMPPAPNTLRARIGAVLVGIVRRMLFWYTPQIASQNMLVAESLAETVQVLRQLSSRIHAVQKAADTAALRADRLESATQEIAVAQHKLGENLSAVQREAAAARQESATQEIAAAQHKLGENLSAVQREAAAARQETLARLSLLEIQQEELEHQLPARLSSLESRQTEREHQLPAQLPAQLSSLERRQAELEHRHVPEQQLWEAARHRLDSTERSLLNLRREVMLQQQRLAVITSEVRRRNGERPSNSEPAIASETDHIQDALYASFEDLFRGTREDIKDRLRIYLPRMREAGAGWPESPALDLGCGRGEWLELLHGERLEGAGVESNRVFVQECRERGLKVTEADALSYLRSLRDASLGAVTAFHVVEHVPLPVLLALLDETVRVLKPGGIAIFETPNPANILVGANTFYYDPTHRNPLPSPLLHFLAESRGLTRVQALALHPDPEGLRLQEDGSEVVRRFNEYFYGPQDYAVIGYKE